MALALPQMRDSAQPKTQLLVRQRPFGGIVTHIQNLKDALEKRTDINCTWLFMEQNPGELISHIPLL